MVLLIYYLWDGRVEFVCSDVNVSLHIIDLHAPKSLVLH